MSSKVIEFRSEPNGVLTDVDSVVFRDPTNTFGIKRIDNDVVVVASNTPLVRISRGVYRYQFTEPAANLSYEYWIRIVYLGNVYIQKQTLQPAAQSSLITLSEFISNGVDIVSCGDEPLADFLNQYASMVWAMQTRRGVVLDLKYQYFVLDLTTLAQDHVRMLIDTMLDNNENDAISQFNASNVSDSQTDSSRVASANSVQSSSSMQSFSRNSQRQSSSSMSASAGQSSNMSGSGSGSTSQQQDSDSHRVGDNNSSTVNTPSASSTFTQIRDSQTTSHADSRVQENMHHYKIVVPFFGDFTGSEGTRSVLSPQNESLMELNATDTINGVSERRQTTVGNGLSEDSITANASGSRSHSMGRSSASSMSGSGTMSSESSMTSSAHSESHRESESAFHSESTSHAEMSSSATAHSESRGISSGSNSGVTNNQYYSQIFASLKQIYDDTLAQIKILEQQVKQDARYILQPLAARTSQTRQTIVCGQPTIVPFAPFLYGANNYPDPTRLR